MEQVITNYEENTKTLTIQITGIDWEETIGESFYSGELKVQSIVQAVGQQLTQDLLEGV